MTDRTPVRKVTDLRATGEGYNLLLEAQGEAGDGARDFALAPRAYDSVPEDGVLDLDFVGEGTGWEGEAATGPVTLALENLENFWGHGNGPLRGVRVHARANSEELQLP